MEQAVQKQLARKDIERIVKLDTQMDYFNAAAVEQYYRQIAEKGILVTLIGKKYMGQLKQVINGSIDWHKCLFCGSTTQGNTMICPACKAKLAGQPAVFCRNCGKQMPAGSDSCPVCGKMKGEGYGYCMHCGKKVPLPDMDFMADFVKQKSKGIAGQTAKMAKENAKKMAEQGSRLRHGKQPKQSAKRMITAIVMLLAVLAAVGLLIKIGQQMIAGVLAFCAVFFLCRLIYKAVKKEPWKRAAVFFAVFLLLAGAADALGGSGRVGGDAVLDYIGAKESAVYKVYGKDGFYSDGICMINDRNNTSGLPHIAMDGGKVIGCRLTAGMDESLHVGGVHIGDDVEQIESCMKKLHAEEKEHNLSEKDGRLYGTVVYTCRHHGKDVTIMIIVNDSAVGEIYF